MVERWIGFGAGLVVVLWTASTVMRTLVVPRGLASRLGAVVSDAVHGSFMFVSNRFGTYEVKDRILALQGAAFLLTQLTAWLALFLVGYSLMLWPLLEGPYAQALLESGSSMFTLGFAATHAAGTTFVHFLAAFTGLVVVALQIGYLPTLYGAFNRRETMVTTLQSRAGAPAWGPEILARYHLVDLDDRLETLYEEWERWAADVAETHTNYPVLLFFRSPHPLRSWILALLAVMDSAALALALRPSLTPTQARLCLRMSFLCLRDIADSLGLTYDPDPLPDDPIDLTYDDFLGAVHRLDEVGVVFERTPEEAWPHFRGWRVNYEQVVYRIADIVVAPPGPWSGPRSHLPGMAIVPRRPVDRRPDDVKVGERPKGMGQGL